MHLLLAQIAGMSFWWAFLAMALGGLAFGTITTFVPSQTYPMFTSLDFPMITVTTLSTAGALTYTTAQVLGGLILRDTNGAGRTDTLPTAALLVAALTGLHVGSSFTLHIRNTASGANTLTVAAGTGGTISGTATVAQNNAKTFRIVFTNITSGSEAYTAYSLGTTVF